MRNIKASGRDVALSPFQYFAQQMLLLHPFTAPIWIAGLIALLFSQRLKPYRMLGWCYLVAFAVFVVLKGKKLGCWASQQAAEKLGIRIRHAFRHALTAVKSMAPSGAVDRKSSFSAKLLECRGLLRGLGGAGDGLVVALINIHHGATDQAGADFRVEAHREGERTEVCVILYEFDLLDEERR